MAKSWLQQLLQKKAQPIHNKPGRYFPILEPLADRILPTVTATFAPGVNSLFVFGDSLDNQIMISRNLAGRILVNGGAVAIQGGMPTVANTSLTQVFGLQGNDVIALNETNGALPKANLFGGDGDDTLQGGSGADTLLGQAGNDSLHGKGGIDILFGGAGNDILVGGAGNDQVFGEAGNDRLISNPGDATDLMEGGDDVDTIEVNGGNGAESFTVTPNGVRVRLDRLSPAPFSLDIGTTEKLVVNLNGGNDTFTGSNGLATLIGLTVNGGAGDDRLLGGDGDDTLIGGDGIDFIDGNRGNDTALMGAGNDVFNWDPGDGSDIVEGQAGVDLLQFNGANVSEKIDISANRERVRFFRDIANITMDLNDVERINFQALGGADTVTVNSLAGTDLVLVDVNLALAIGGTSGDTSIDSVIVNGTSGADAINVINKDAVVSVTGLQAIMRILNSDANVDQLTVSGLGGNDAISAATLTAPLPITLDGGAGNDNITGSAAADILFGGDNDDVINGKQGNDVALLGAGTDTFVWNPGDGSDTVEGQDGADRLTFNGSNAIENFDLSANGARLRLSRDVGSIVMDVNDIETVEINALGGADTIVVNDLTGTDVTAVNVNLAAMLGGHIGDGQVDQVVVNATAGDDSLVVASSPLGVVVAGGPANVLITTSEPTKDKLTVNALAGADVVNAFALPAGMIGLTINGGAGADFLFGSAGDDLILGGTGDDVALMGTGNDTFVWNPGDGSDIVEGQAGIDTLQFNGANISEKIAISPNGGRVRFTRDVANITMDLNDTERINFAALGGIDSITIDDLAGTDVTEINLNLNGAGVNTGDGQPDTVTLNGSADADAVLISGNQKGVTAMGLAATVNIVGAEAANDRLVVNAGAGDDVVFAVNLAANAIQFTADGGDDDDVLFGGFGIDTLLGGAGDDILIGGPGADVLDGGTGNNIIIPD